MLLKTNMRIIQKIELQYVVMIRFSKYCKYHYKDGISFVPSLQHKEHICF